MNVLVTCPPMLRSIDEFRGRFVQKKIELLTPDVVQAMTECELLELVPLCDGWIIGDDPATRAVFEAGKRGNLKAAVKWGVGIDNVDIQAATELGIQISHTPNMFGKEVADVAMSYVVALARETFNVDRGVRSGLWPKPVGISLAGKTVALVGFGDIGKNTARRLLAAEMRLIAYDPHFQPLPGLDGIEVAVWPERLSEADFIVLTCALTKENRHMLNSSSLRLTKKGVRIVNVSRGGLIDEPALIEALVSGHVHSAALEVFENEPLPVDSPLRAFDQCVFGSHNASNTIDAVLRTSNRAVDLLFEFLHV